jgi:hypothetical protein
MYDHSWYMVASFPGLYFSKYGLDFTGPSTDTMDPVE